MLILIVAVAGFSAYQLWAGNVDVALAAIGLVGLYLIVVRQWTRRRAYRMFLTGVRFRQENPTDEPNYWLMRDDAMDTVAVMEGISAAERAIHTGEDPITQFNYDEIWNRAKDWHGRTRGFRKF